jgi:hypothetical protein
MTNDQRRPDAIEPPDGPEGAPANPASPGGEEFSRPGGDEFDGGRGGVAPEFPGSPDERGAPDGPPDGPGTDVPDAPDDPGASALDEHVARQPGGPDQLSVENLDGTIDRDRLSAPNQGFRTGG